MLLNLKWLCFSIKIHARQSLPMFKHLIESFWAITISLHFWIVVYRGRTLLRPAPQDLGRITACASSAATHAASFGESGTGGAHASSCFLMLPHASSFNAKEYWPALLVFFSLQNLNADCKMKTNEKQCGGSLCKGMERMSQSPSVTNPRPRKHKNTEELNTSKIIYIYRSEYIFIQFYRSDIVRRIPQSLVWYIMPSIYKYHVHLTLRDAALWRLCLLATHRLPNCCAHVDSHHHHHQRPWPENIGHTFLSHS